MKLTVCTKCGCLISNNNYTKHIRGCTGNAPYCQTPKLTKCKWCGLSFKGMSTAYIANHSRWCKNNPKHNEYLQAAAALCTNSNYTSLNNFRWCCDNLKHNELKRKLQSEKIKEAWKRGAYRHVNCQGMLGKHHTEETKLKISRKLSKYYKDGKIAQTCGRSKKYNYCSQVAGPISVDGTWELAVAKYFDGIGVKWERNIKRFPYKNTLTGRMSVYIPDFYVYDWNTYIEVKGYETELDHVKWKQFKFPLEIWKQDKLKRLKLI